MLGSYTLSGGGLPLCVPCGGNLGLPFQEMDLHDPLHDPHLFPKRGKTGVDSCQVGATTLDS